ncbi:MAG: hypothetical protein ACREV7_19235 [Steroidobacteraceae bacterium]
MPSAEPQRALSYKLATTVGHSTDNLRIHLRIDIAPHPFTCFGSPGDNRITVRFDADNPRFAGMATVHESWHALYESRLPREHAFLPVGAPRWRDRGRKPVPYGGDAGFALPGIPVVAGTAARASLRRRPCLLERRECSERLSPTRTGQWKRESDASPFHGGNTGSNPVGNAIESTCYFETD